MSASDNVLLSFDGLPPFSQIRPQQVKPAVEQAIAQARAAVERAVASTDVSWASLIEQTEHDSERLSKLWSPVSHMNSVVNSPELREAYESCLPLLSEFSTWLGQHEGLYQKYQQLAQSAEYAALTPAQQKVIQNALRDFKLSGIGLSADKKQRYAEIQSRLSDLSSQFSNNTLDATQAWFKHITNEADLAGLPEDARLAAAEEAKSRELAGWVFTLEFPSYIAVMTYADSRQLREELYSAYCTRASDQGPTAGQFDNTAIIEETLALKHEVAQLLDFNNAAEESLATKMAESPAQVLDFLHDLARRAKPQAEQDLAELSAFAQNEFAVTELAAWDVTYYAEQLKQAKYSISDEQLRPYFPEHQVVQGLFTVLNKLFGVSVKQRDAVDVWHSDVKFYDIFDASGELRGSFYLDLYARASKRGGAWMNAYVPQNGLTGTLPVVANHQNIPKPAAGQPTLMTFDEVTTMFHEFGHALHGLFSKVKYPQFAGTSVPRDFVEYPSQVNEMWATWPTILANYAKHHETGEPIPQALLDKVLATEQFGQGHATTEYLAAAMLDQSWHQLAANEVPSDTLAFEAQALKAAGLDYAPVPPRYRSTYFSHIMGGYSAGYYAYLWSEVLDAESVEWFKENGGLKRENGDHFRKTLLSRGGSVDAMQLFRDFRGRDPQVGPLLKRRGLEVAPKTGE